MKFLIQRILIVSLILSSLALFAVEKTPTEVYLAYGHEFQITNKDEIPKQLLQSLADLKAKNRKTPKDYLLIGDVYHWLGHIAEDMEDFEKAQQYYQASMDEGYSLTRITNSNRINNLNGIEHAEYHLYALQDLARIPAFFRVLKRVQFAAEIGGPEYAKQVTRFTPETLHEQSDTLRNLCSQLLK